jgi:hypothetical protein
VAGLAALPEAQRLAALAALQYGRRCGRRCARSSAFLGSAYAYSPYAALEYEGYTRQGARELVAGLAALPEAQRLAALAALRPEGCGRRCALWVQGRLETRMLPNPA